MLCIADPRAISKFVTAIAEMDGSAVLHLINQLSEDGADLRQLNLQVMEYWRASMLTRAGADTAAILDLTQDEMDEIKQLAQRFALEELTECARLFAQNDLALKNQGTPQLGLEIAALESIETHRRALAGPTPAVTATAREHSARPAAHTPPPPPLTPADYPTRAAQTPRNMPAREAETRSTTPEKAARPQEDMRSVPDRQEAVTAPAASQNGTSSLTAQQIINAWANVIKRTKQKSSMLAAYMAYYKVVGIEGSPEHPVVVIQTEKSTHYDYVRDKNRYKDLEWALEVEFGLPCQVRLVPPGQSPSLAPMADTASYSTGAALAPQPSAYREPPPTKQSPPTLREAPPESAQPPQDPPVVDLYTSSPGATGTTPARTNMVRENKPLLSKETLEQKVRHDPVIQEVMRTFSAKIVDIRPK